MTVVTALTNHPGMTLREDAAASLERFEADHGVLDVNRAGVSRAAQQAVIDRWNKGGAHNRPPFLYQPASVDGSMHVKQIALDSDTPTKLTEHPEYGWYRPLPKSDPPHCVYDPARDTRKPTNAPADAGTSPIAPSTGEPEMNGPEAAQLKAANDNAAEARRVAAVIIGASEPKTEAERIYRQQQAGIIENLNETRRMLAVVLGARQPAPGESRP